MNSVNSVYQCNLLVDCGVATYIINDRSKLISFDSFRHIIELADGRRSNNLAVAKREVKIYLEDMNGCESEVTIKDAICIHLFKLDIFLVQTTAENGSSDRFNPNSASLEGDDGTSFEIEKSRILYFLNNIQSSKSSTMEEWHKT